MDFRYDADHERTIESGSNGTLTLYVGRQFFEVSIQGATTTGKAYLATPDGIIGVVTQTTANTLGRRYWYRDHIGSIVAERDSATAQTVYLGFDEWGARRGSFAPTSTATARGFTGHEHLDTPFTLVHMNGRIYDPVASRFVSADPILQDATNPQSFNRYAYVYNNPLSFTDPQGFSAWSQWIRPVVITVATWYDRHRQTCDLRHHWATIGCARLRDMPSLIGTVNLEHALCQIAADRRNLHVDAPLGSSGR